MMVLPARCNLGLDVGLLVRSVIIGNTMYTRLQPAARPWRSGAGTAVVTSGAAHRRGRV